ncbi:BamA/OMP85 family outer membrane protein [Blattabacterium cuenoti]|uniref:BamA/OMP85 family outer membrane protein n=1 Tax=Blattabacterium cuenoti TaxID=1653831 RepID=UPI00163C2D47|nr:POTRA domain-containing protein [Blattabacterium cuenoti]
MKKNIVITIFGFLIMMQILQQKSYSFSNISNEYEHHKYIIRHIDDLSIRNENNLFRIRKIHVFGQTKYDHNFISKLSNIYSGDFIDLSENKINEIINVLWKNNLFQDISVYKKQISKNEIDLFFELKDLIEIDEIIADGIQIDEFPILKNIKPGYRISVDFIQNIKNEIIEYYKDKGYDEISVKCSILKKDNDNEKNILHIDVNQGRKIGIKEILFEGNKELSSEQLLKYMKKTKKSFYIPIIDSSNYVFVEKNIQEDIKSIIDKYQSMGFIDVKIFLDSVWKKSFGDYIIKIKIIEGDKYYLENDVEFFGNKNISTSTLKDIFTYKKNDIYDRINISHKIFDPKNTSILNTYLNLGFLFVKINPIEKIIGNNKIHLTIQIEENQPVYINDIKISGNSITNDYVIIREITTHKGDLFSAKKVKESLLNLESLKLFKNVYPNVYPINENSVDIEWCVVEQNTNEIQFYGGFDGKSIKKFIGDFRLNFNNFSLKNFFNWSLWNPIPQGDNQKLSLFSKLGKDFLSYGFYFTEPWLGSKINPTSITLHGKYSLKRIKDNDDDFLISQINENNKIADIKTQILERKGASIQVDKFLKFLDPYLSASFLIDYDFSSYKREMLSNSYYEHIFGNLSSLVSFQRISTKPDFIFPLEGSKMQFNIEFTPPYSFIFKSDNNNNGDINKKIEWMEYSKFRMNSSWYKKIMKDMVIRIGGEFGCLATNQKSKLYPFQKFYMGEIPSKFFGLEDIDVITLRGYNTEMNNSKYPMLKTGGIIYDKIILELRYLININNIIPNVPNNIKIWTNSFVEGGSISSSYRKFNPFLMNKSFGFGIRSFISPIGFLGIDVIYPIDLIDKKPFLSKWKTRFFIGKDL